MNVDKAEDDSTQNADTQKCEDDHNLLVIDIISENRNTVSSQQSILIKAKGLKLHEAIRVVCNVSVSEGLNVQCNVIIHISATKN